jgi:hypothetical protein
LVASQSLHRQVSSSLKKNTALEYSTRVVQEGAVDVKRVLFKVPKREIFVTELIILSHPIWIGDLRNDQKIDLYELLGCYSPFWFFSAD